MDQSKDLFIPQIGIIMCQSWEMAGNRKSLLFSTPAVTGKDTPLHGYAVVSHKEVQEVICDKLSLTEIRGHSMIISGESLGGGHAKAGVGPCAEDRDSSWGWKGGKGSHARTQGAAQRCQPEARSVQNQL